eukprot:9305127-Pyramimonas_sp.AAC.1
MEAVLQGANSRDIAPAGALVCVCARVCSCVYVSCVCVRDAGCEERLFSKRGVTRRTTAN